MTEYAAPILPTDLPAERAALGACLLDREAVIAVAPFLSPEMFYLETHGLIYAAILACYARREPPDLATVASQLRTQEQLATVGGLAFLGELVAEVPTAVHVAYYARSVEQAHLRRQLISTGGQIAALGYAPNDDLAATFGQAEQALFAVTQRRAGRDYAPLSVVVNDVLARLQHIREAGGLAGLPSGYPDLDAITGGLQASDLILLAARPSLGKTALALCLGYNVARRGGRVGIFSLEMSRDQLGQRMLAMHTGLDLQRLRVGRLSDDELAAAMDGMAHLHALPIVIDDTSGVSVTDLRARARRMHAEHGLDLVIVDYLQLMSGGAQSRQGNRTQEVSEISRGMKALARELNVPVIALSQLSRAVEEREDHTPRLSDLRESGALEQDADLVLFLYREEVYDRETERPGTGELHIAKHRNGPLGIVPLRFDHRTTRFLPLSFRDSL